MNEPYEEIIDGETLLRFAPGARHEEICTRLHARVAACLANLTSTRRLTPRGILELRTGTLFRPDLALVTAATGKLWLAAEIISSDDHHTDTVLKKAIYEELNVPRLWMIDPRYNNLEVYHASPYGLRLHGILAGQEVLHEQLLPGLELCVAELFG